MAGRRGRGIRARLNHAKDMGLGYRFSHDAADFDRFYHEMYLPFVSRRHGQLASVSSYEALRTHFERGGLLLITHGPEDVAGSVCYLQDGVLYAVEEGIVNGDPELLRIGINAFLYWCSFQWALQHKAHGFSLGASYATVADGAFNFKSHWGARARRWRGLADYWEVWAGRLAPPQVERLNALELVARQTGSIACGSAADAIARPAGCRDGGGALAGLDGCCGWGRPAVTCGARRKPPLTASGAAPPRHARAWNAFFSGGGTDVVASGKPAACQGHGALCLCAGKGMGDNEDAALAICTRCSFLLQSRTALAQP